MTNLPATRTVDDVASFLSSEVDISAGIHSSQSTVFLYDTPSVRSFDNGDLERIPLTTRNDSCDVFGSVETSNCKSEDSLYSMDSADQDAHPVLLSMPIIPQIKLERKATVRKLDPDPLSNTTQHHAFLSPRIADLRTPARMSSRRYGRILSAPSAPAAFIGVPQGRSHGTLTFQVPQQAYQRSVSEPALSFPCLDDEEEPVLQKGIESPNSDLLLSMIDEVGTSAVPHNDHVESDISEALRPEQVPPKHATPNHRRSSLNHSISFSGILHAFVDGYASLDHLLRKPKIKCKSTTVEPKLVKLDLTSKWAPKEGQIFIKVFVPSTDDIWMFRVPQDISLIHFTSRVVAKLGFVVSFSGSVWDEPKYYFRTDEQFKSWVKGRIRFGRNLPIVAHVLARLPLVRLSVDADGCEVWCYA